MRAKTTLLAIVVLVIQLFPVNLLIQAKPTIEINDIVDFGGSGTNTSFTINNADTTKHQVKMACNSPKLKFSSITATINPGSSTTVKVTLDRKGLPTGNFRATITVSWVNGKVQKIARAYVSDGLPTWPAQDGFQQGRSPSSSNIEPKKLNLLWSRKEFESGVKESRRWSHPNTDCIAIAGGNRVYTKNRDSIACFDMQTGKQVWRKQEAGNNRIFWLDGKIIVNNYESTTYALDCDTGDIIWKNPKLPIEFVADGYMYTKDSCYGPDMRLIWKGREFKSCLTNGILFGSDGNKIYGLHSKTGKVLWERNLSNMKICYATRSVFVLQQDYEKIIGLDANNGKTLWETKVNGSIRFAVNGKFVVTQYISREILLSPSSFALPDQNIYIYDATNGKQLGKLEGDNTENMSIAGNYLYVSTSGLRIYNTSDASVHHVIREVEPYRICTVGSKVIVIDYFGNLQCWSSGEGVLFSEEFGNFGTVQPKTTSSIEIGVENVGKTKLSATLSVDMPYAWLPVKDLVLEPLAKTKIKINLNLTNFKGTIARSLSGNLTVKAGSYERKIRIRGFVDAVKPEPDALSLLAKPPWEELGVIKTHNLERYRYRKEVQLDYAYASQGKIVQILEGGIRHFDPSTMKETFSAKLDCPKPIGVFPDSKGSVYVTVENDGSLRKFDEATGRLSWKVDVASKDKAFTGSVLTSPDKVFCFWGDVVTCLDARNGKQSWTYVPDIGKKTGEESHGIGIEKQALVGNRLFFAYRLIRYYDNLIVFCLDAGTGKLVGKTELGKRSFENDLNRPFEWSHEYVTQSMLVHRDKVLVQTYGHMPYNSLASVFCFDAVTGKQVYSIDDFLLYGYSVRDGLLAGEIIGYDGTMFFESDTGKPVIHSSLPKICAKVGDLLEVSSYRSTYPGNIHFISEKTGMQVREIQVPLDQPFVPYPFGGRFFTKRHHQDKIVYDRERVTPGLTVYGKAKERVEMTVGSKTIIADGASSELPVGPQVNDDKVYIPIRKVLDALGGDVRHDEGDGFDIIYFGKRITLSFGSNTYWDGPVQRKLDDKDPKVVPYELEMEIMVPMWSVCQLIGLGVEYDTKTGKIVIFSKK